MDFEGRHVVVTGGAGALGEAVVAALLDAGAHCHLPVRRPGAEGSAVSHARARVTPGIDLTDEAAVNAFYRGVPDLWASIHLAGGFDHGPIAQLDGSRLRQQLETNVVTTYLCCRAAVAAMAGRAGRIVNVAARPGLEWRGGANMVAYAAAKAAVAALTVALAEETAKQHILVNAVAPSVIDTPANRTAMPKADHGRWPKPAAIAATILHLASPRNSVTRGSVVTVYGEA